MILLLLVGCLSEAEVMAEMEEALKATNDAIALGLVTAELFRHIDAPAEATPRHGTGVGCPFVEQQGPDASHVLLLDYPTLGCVPSDLLRARTSGHVWLDVQPDGVAIARIETVSIEVAPLTGDLSGGFQRDSTSWVALLSGDLAVGDIAGRLSELSVEVDPDGITLDGTVRTQGTPLILRSVRLDVDDIARGGCPQPSSGRASRGEVQVQLGGPDVDVSRGRWVSTGHLCRYRVGFLP